MSERRQLGLVSATALVVASMIGAGVFTTSGFLLKDLGSPGWVLLAWGVGGVQALLGALCYGALARRLPESGGEYLFLSRTLHPAAGYLAGWISLVVGFSAPLAAVAYAFGDYAGPWLGGCPAKISGSFLILLFAGLHATTVQRGAQVQNAIVIAKCLGILLFAAWALPRVHWEMWGEMQAPFSGPAFAVSLVWISFSYSGWNAAVYVAGEVKDPERNLPRSVVLGAGLVTLLYLLMNAVFLLAAPHAEIAGQLQVGRIAARSLGGVVLGEIVAGLIVLALLTSASSLMMAGPRVYAQMAGDGNLPRWLGVVAGPPRRSIALQAGLALLLLWTSQYDGLLTYIGFTLGLSTAAAVAGLVCLRWREGIAVRVPGWPWVPGLFLVAVGGMAVFSIAQRPRESLVVLAVLGVGWGAWQLQHGLTRGRPPR